MSIKSNFQALFAEENSESANSSEKDENCCPDLSLKTVKLNV